jgi:uncharacterized phage protein gp47/JayE
MATRTQDEVIFDLINTVLTGYEKADVFPGQVLRDIVVNAPSQEFANLYNELGNAQQAQSISNAAIMTASDLDKLVANFGIVRKGASVAFGSVVFYTTTAPSTNITIPEGTILGTGVGQNGQEVTFVTRYRFDFNKASQSNYWNPDTGSYEFPVDVVAQNPGSNGNVGPFTITKIKSGGIPFSVTNRASTTGGTDQENNIDLATRALNAFLGSNKGTKAGYTSLVLAQDGVYDAIVQGPGDPLMIRDNGLGGKVDIWTITAPSTITQLGPSNNSNLQFQWNQQAAYLLGEKYNFPVVPIDVDSPITVNGLVSPTGVTILLYEKHSPAPAGVAYIASGNYHYEVIKDDSLDYGHSYKAIDQIKWNSSQIQSSISSFPGASGMTISINYSYNQKINDLQTLLNNDDNHIVTSDVLAKEARKILVDVASDVVLLPEYKVTSATESLNIANIVDAVTNYINTNRLGNKIEASDIVQVIHNVAGVDNVKLPSVIITKKRNQFYDVVNQNITDDTTGPNEYFESDVITIRSVAK